MRLFRILVCHGNEEVPFLVVVTGTGCAVNYAQVPDEGKRPLHGARIEAGGWEC